MHFFLNVRVRAFDGHKQERVRRPHRRVLHSLYTGVDEAATAIQHFSPVDGLEKHMSPHRGFASVAWALVFCGVGRPSLAHPEKCRDPHPPPAVKEGRRNSDVQYRRDGIGLVGHVRGGDR